MSKLCIVIAAILLLVSSNRIIAQNVPSSAERARLDKIQQSLKDDVPRILCINEDFATGAQPSGSAYSKLAANGFHSVLNLRTAEEGADLEMERKLVTGAGMRYFSIPVISTAPRPEQADQFIRIVKDTPNHPMLIHCASANRVGAFMMIYRTVEHGWPEEKAYEEAVKIGLSSDGLKKFAHDYIAGRKPK
jgi:protein tyrosine phosphatase (PTP) superfamily phosphohydrolase (DUF442 family)